MFGTLPLQSSGNLSATPLGLSVEVFHIRWKAKAIKKKDQAQGQRQHSIEKLLLIPVLEEGQPLEERGSTPAKSASYLELINRTQLGKVLRKEKADVPSGNLLFFDSVHE